MIDQSITSRPLTLNGDLVLYELGPGNWRNPWLPDLHHLGRTIELANNRTIDIIMLGDGFTKQSCFRTRIQDYWLHHFLRQPVYREFRGVLRVRALYRNSAVGARAEPFYGTPLDPTRLRDDITLLSGVNERRYPAKLDVKGVRVGRALGDTYSNLIVVMFMHREQVNGAAAEAADLVTTAVLDNGAKLPVVVGDRTTAGLGEALALLDDEAMPAPAEFYERTRNADGDRAAPNLFALSNITAEPAIDRVPWFHLSPWGVYPRQAASPGPAPIVGWLWKSKLHPNWWHSEHTCALNSAAADEHYCMWCQEIIAARILEKAGRLAEQDDGDDLTAQLLEAYYERWLADWRPAYLRFFGVKQQIQHRERMHALKSLARTKLYEVFHASSESTRELSEDIEDATDCSPSEA